VETTAATSYDGAAIETIHAALEAKELLPEEHIVDSGYLGAEVLAGAQAQQGITLLGPVPEDTTWQAQDAQAFDLTHFTIDWQKQQVTCPEGKTSRHWIETYNRHGKDVIHARVQSNRLSGLSQSFQLYPSQSGSAYAQLSSRSAPISSTPAGTTTPESS
jgi:transposase